MASDIAPYRNPARYAKSLSGGAGDPLPGLQPPAGKTRSRQKKNRGKRKSSNSGPLAGLTPPKPSARTRYIDKRLGGAGGLVTSGADDHTGAVYGPDSYFAGLSPGQGFETANSEFDSLPRSERRAVQKEANQLHGYKNPNKGKKETLQQKMQSRLERTGNPYRDHQGANDGFSASSSNGPALKPGERPFTMRSESQRRERVDHMHHLQRAGGTPHAKGTAAVAAKKQEQAARQPQTTTVGNVTSLRLPDGTLATGTRPAMVESQPYRPAASLRAAPQEISSLERPLSGMRPPFEQTGKAPRINDANSGTRQTINPNATPGAGRGRKLGSDSETVNPNATPGAGRGVPIKAPSSTPEPTGLDTMKPPTSESGIGRIEEKPTQAGVDPARKKKPLNPNATVGAGRGTPLKTRG